jgi:hypothetical protein
MKSLSLFFMPNESFAMRGRFKTFFPPGRTAGGDSIVMPIEILEDLYAKAQNWGKSTPKTDLKGYTEYPIG